MFCWSSKYSIYKLDMFVLVIENPGGKIFNYNMYNRLGIFFQKGKIKSKIHMQTFFNHISWDRGILKQINLYIQCCFFYFLFCFEIYHI